MKPISLIVIITFAYSVGCSKSADKRTEAILLNDYAMSLTMRGKLDSAIIVQQLAIEKDSTDYLLYSNYSKLLVMRRNFPQALDAMKSVLKVKPNLAEAAFWIGMYYDYTSDSLNSKLYIDSALSLYNNRLIIKDTCDTRVNRAFALLWKGDSAKARIDIDWLIAAECDTFLVSLLTKFDKKEWFKEFN